jgi:hypothetical protein
MLIGDQTNVGVISGQAGVAILQKLKNFKEDLGIKIKMILDNKNYG